MIRHNEMKYYNIPTSAAKPVSGSPQDNKSEAEWCNIFVTGTVVLILGTTSKLATVLVVCLSLSDESDVCFSSYANLRQAMHYSGVDGECSSQAGLDKFMVIACISFQHVVSQ